MNACCLSAVGLRRTSMECRFNSAAELNRRLGYLFRGLCVAVWNPNLGTSTAHRPYHVLHIHWLVVHITSQ